MWQGNSASLPDIEKAWLEHAATAICQIIADHPNESFYAGAFWHFYCDYTAILPPALALNAESHVVTHDDGEAWSKKWVPAEWQWPVLDKACDPLKPVYANLSDSMTTASDSEWDALIQAHDQLIANVSRVLTSQIHSKAGPFREIPFRNTFLVAAIDDQRDTDAYNALVRQSVDPTRLANTEDLLW